MYGHVKKTKTRTKFLEFCRYLRTLYPADVRIAIVCDNFSPHLTTKRCRRVAAWAQANNVEIAYTPTNSSWLNRIEAQFTGLRYFALDGTDHPSHKAQGSMIRRYILWRNSHPAAGRSTRRMYHSEQKSARSTTSPGTRKSAWSATTLLTTKWPVPESTESRIAPDLGYRGTSIRTGASWDSPATASRSCPTVNSTASCRYRSKLSVTPKDRRRTLPLANPPSAHVRRIWGKRCLVRHWLPSYGRSESSPGARDLRLADFTWLAVARVTAPTSHANWVWPRATPCPCCTSGTSPDTRS